jgi:hypothetical protein
MITPRVAVRKTTKMFCVNMKMLLFEDEEYKDQYLEITTLAKI